MTSIESHDIDGHECQEPRDHKQYEQPGVETTRLNRRWGHGRRPLLCRRPQLGCKPAFPGHTAPVSKNLGDAEKRVDENSGFDLRCKP